MVRHLACLSLGIFGGVMNELGKSFELGDVLLLGYAIGVYFSFLIISAQQVSI